MPADDVIFDFHEHDDHIHRTTGYAHIHDRRPYHHHDSLGSIHYVDNVDLIHVGTGCDLIAAVNDLNRRSVRDVVDGGADAAPIGCVGLDVSYRTR